MYAVADQLPRLGKRELICLLSVTCNYVVSVWNGFRFLWVLGMGCVILLWHSLNLPYNHFIIIEHLNNIHLLITCCHIDFSFYFSFIKHHELQASVQILKYIVFTIVNCMFAGLYQNKYCLNQCRHLSGSKLIHTNKMPHLPFQRANELLPYPFDFTTQFMARGSST